MLYVLAEEGWGLRTRGPLPSTLCVAETQLRWPLVGDLLVVADSRQWSCGEGHGAGRKQCRQGQKAPFPWATG